MVKDESESANTEDDGCKVEEKTYFYPSRRKRIR